MLTPGRRWDGSCGKEPPHNPAQRRTRPARRSYVQGRRRRHLVTYPDGRLHGVFERPAPSPRARPAATWRSTCAGREGLHAGPLASQSSATAADHDCCDEPSGSPVNGSTYSGNAPLCQTWSSPACRSCAAAVVSRACRNAHHSSQLMTGQLGPRQYRLGSKAGSPDSDGTSAGSVERSGGEHAPSALALGSHSRLTRTAGRRLRTPGRTPWRARRSRCTRAGRPALRRPPSPRQPQATATHRRASRPTPAPQAHRRSARHV